MAKSDKIYQGTSRVTVEGYVAAVKRTGITPVRGILLEGKSQRESQADGQYVACGCGLGTYVYDHAGGLNYDAMEVYDKLKLTRSYRAGFMQGFDGKTVDTDVKFCVANQDSYREFGKLPRDQKFNEDGYTNWSLHDDMYRVSQGEFDMGYEDGRACAHAVFDLELHKKLDEEEVVEATQTVSVIDR